VLRDYFSVLDDDSGKVYDGPSIRPSLVDLPGETFKNKEKKLEAGDVGLPDGSSTFQVKIHCWCIGIYRDSGCRSYRGSGKLE